MADLAQQALDAWHNVQMLQRGLQSLQGAQGVSAQQMAGQRAAIDRAYQQLSAANAARDAANRPAAPAGPTAQDLYYDALRAQLAEQQRQAREAASSFLRSTLTTYNMESLAGRVDELVRQWGTNTEVIAEKLRQTTEYKDRFKGLLGLQQRGITDVTNEGDYIRLESSYRAVFREAGIQSFLGDAGSTTERDSIADLVGKYSLSVDEVRARVTDAQRVVTESNPEVRDALQRFYNVSASDLVAYTLDPERTMGRINRIANAAMVGGYAEVRGLDIDLNTAEGVAGLAQEGDINTQQLSTDLTQTRIVRDATKRLADIEDTDLTDSEILQSELNLAPDAQRKVKALQSRERARFTGQSGITSNSLMRNRSI